MEVQQLTLTLEDITAGDYLAWLRDPDPPALGGTLCDVDVRADPLGDTVCVLLAWRDRAPEPRLAAPLAGLPLGPGITVHEPPRLAAAA